MNQNQDFNTILLGVSFESNNLGVNALGIGAVSLIFNNNPNAKIAAITLGNNSNKQFSLSTKTGIINVELIYFTKIQYLIALIKAFILRFLKINFNSNLITLFNNSTNIYNVNEGDSFSDIYGLKRLLRHYIDSKLALILQKPLILLPQTIGPFKTKIGQYLSKDILTKAEKVYVRDIKANEYLETIGIKSELAFDLAVYMNPKYINIRLKPKTIGININGLMYLNRYGSLRGQFTSYPNLIHELVLQLLNNGWNILFIPHTYSIKEPCEEDDLISIIDFCQKYKLTQIKQISIITEQFDAQEIKHILSQLDYFIGSRMHACIGALSSNIPTFAFAYSYKFHGTFDMFNEGDCMVEVNNLEEEQIKIIIKTVLNKINHRDISSKNLSNYNIHADLNIND